MSQFATKVNAVSSMIATLSEDPAERLGIISVLAEMYKYEVSKTFVPLKPNAPDNAAAAAVPAEAQAGGTA